MIHTARFAPICALVMLALLPAWAFAWKSGDETTCPVTGRYSNAEYLFSVTLPGNLKGCPDSPVGMSDHGVLVRIGTDSSIDVFASYNALFFESIDAAADWEVENLTKASAPGSFQLRSRTRQTLGGLRAIRIVANYRKADTNADEAADITVALRAVKGQESLGKYWISYVVSLASPAHDFPSQRQLLDRILKSWATRPPAQSE
jgi:hypothetical protein